MGHVGQVGEQPKSNKIVKIIVIAFLVFLVIAAIVAGATAGKEGEDDGSQPSIQQFTHDLNEEIEYDGLKIKVYSGHYESSFCGIEEPSQTGKILFVVDVKITNVTSKTKKFKSGTYFPSPVYTYDLIFDNDYSYGGTYKQYTNFLLAYNEIEPLQTIDASLCFSVPDVVKTDTVKELKLKFKKNKIDDVDEIHYWIFREGVAE